MVLVALWLGALASVSGLVADGGMLLAERRALQNLADAAAAAGAMALDEGRYRASGGSEVSLDGAAARAAAEGYLRAAGGVAYTVTAGRARVEVAVERRAPTAFLRVVGIGQVTIRARASAEPRHGVVMAGAPAGAARVVIRLARPAALAASVLAASVLAAALLAAAGGRGEPGVEVTGAAPAAAAAPEAAPQAPPHLPTPVAEAAPRATPALSVEREVEAAYLAYWEAYAEAALHLDPSPLAGVASGRELARMRGEIASLRESGVALRVVVEHDPLVVVTSGTSAVVVDRLTNRSFYVDPLTKRPPRAEGGGEVLRDTVFMEKEDGRWRAVDSQREIAP